MIARIRGELAEVSPDGVVVLCGGLGYEVRLPATMMARLPAAGSPMDLAVRLVVRQDDWSLYGFESRQGRALFDVLVEVKNCGPKTALALLGELGEERLASALLDRDMATLVQASGVGPKLAERLILETRDKVAAVLAVAPTKGAVSMPGDDDLLQALLALGYRRIEAETAAAQSRDAGESLEDQLRDALRRLGK